MWEPGFRQHVAQGEEGTEQRTAAFILLLIPQGKLVTRDTILQVPRHPTLQLRPEGTGDAGTAAGAASGLAMTLVASSGHVAPKIQGTAGRDRVPWVMVLRKVELWLRIHEMIEGVVDLGGTSWRWGRLDEDVDAVEAASVWGSGSG